MSSFKSIGILRGFVRRNITQMFDKRHQWNALDALERKKVKGSLEAYRDEIENYNKGVIDKLETDQSVEDLSKELEKEYVTVEDYRSKIRECFLMLEVEGEDTQQSIRSPVETDVGDQTVSHRGEMRSLLKCPTVPLPTYNSTDEEDLLKFFREFEASLQRFPMSEYDKFILLKSQLKGRALVLVQSLEAHKQSFTAAKQLLMDALASVEQQKAQVIKQLKNLKFQEGADPLSYIAVFRTLTDRIEHLKISKEDFLRFFFWEGLTYKFKEIFVAVTNNNNPTLEQLTKHFFSAADRYQSYNHVRPEYVKLGTKSQSLAINVGAKPVYPCVLCADDKQMVNHPIYKCNKFKSSKDKIDQLKKLGGCFKCGRLKHSASNCKFRLKEKCKNCAHWHFTFLCPEDKKGSSPEREVQSNVVVVVNNCTSYQKDRVFLPTFSVEVENDFRIRGLKDSGSQKSFISQFLANKLSLSSQRKINICLKGVNCDKQYFTDIVSMNLKVGSSWHKIEAIVLPKISPTVTYNKEGVLLTKEFEQLGYKVADELFYKNSKYIDLILGVSDAYLLPEKDVVFGVADFSTCSMSPLGIMFKGDIDNLFRNVGKFPRNKKVQTTNISSLCCSTEQQNLKLPGLDTSVLSEREEVVQSVLRNASAEQIQKHFYKCLEIDQIENIPFTSEQSELIQFALETCSRNAEGRIIMPILWKVEVAHKLSKNESLAKSVLTSTLKKYRREPEKLEMMSAVVKEQEKSGIIEKLDFEEFAKTQINYSFLPHMPVFRMNKQTTKCRLVFLSNLCEGRTQGFLSHNSTIWSGPCLNSKLSVALIHLRFDKYLLAFDLVKAFNNIELFEQDANKLLFYWQNKEQLLVYKNVRLPFGLRCSPMLLMLTLYKILILDAEDENISVQKVKKLTYQLSYMDNCHFSTNTKSELLKAVEILKSVFNEYCFPLQQFSTNELTLQEQLDGEVAGDKTAQVVQLLGLDWDRCSDTFAAAQFRLDPAANSKRTILSSIASQFDLLGTMLPLLNRARLFLHKLQCKKELGWDIKLSKSELQEWSNIVRQVDQSKPMPIKRFVGKRDDEYDLLGFSDSSVLMFGVVIYVRSVQSGSTFFVAAKNRITAQGMGKRTIPVLELQALELAVDTVTELKDQLSGPSCLVPIKIRRLEVHSDSIVALSWVQRYTQYEGNPQKFTVFVQNRLENILRKCENCTVHFKFIAGTHNPADFTTRPVSYYLLSRSNFHTGPINLNSESNMLLGQENINPFQVPASFFRLPEVLTSSSSAEIREQEGGSEIFTRLLTRISSFSRMVRVLSRVFGYICKLKLKVKERISQGSPAKNSGQEFARLTKDGANCFLLARQFLFRQDQAAHFPEVIEYLNNPVGIRKIPSLVSQFNLYLDSWKVLRMKAKFPKEHEFFSFPIFMARKSQLTTLIIRDYHEKLSHVGCYALLARLRKLFWIQSFFSVVRNVLRKCIVCRRLNARTVKLNQGLYRDFRASPPQCPFRVVFVDFMGPITFRKEGIGKEGSRGKCYVLVVTCTWSRAVNLKLCEDLTVGEFLRAFQLHCYDHGLPQRIISDLGSQLVAGAKIVSELLQTPDVNDYLAERNIAKIQFEQFYRGNSALGSLVEVCVKMCKRLIYGAIGHNVLSFRDLDFIIQQTVHLINKRPVGLKEVIRSKSAEEMPDVITPEILLRGYELPSLDLLPVVQEDDPEWRESSPSEHLKLQLSQLQKVRSSLKQRYHEEFLVGLISQAVDKKDRYAPVTNSELSIGDIVLIKDPFIKPTQYPMGVIREVTKNSLGEVTAAIILKGRTGELIKRHAEVLIPLLSLSSTPLVQKVCESEVVKKARPTRKAAKQARKKFRTMS